GSNSSTSWRSAAFRAQFSEVKRLHGEASKLSRMERSHIWEAEKSAKEAEAVLDPLTRNRLLEERDRLYKLATDLEREAPALRSQAANIRPLRFAGREAFTYDRD